MKYSGKDTLDILKKVADTLIEDLIQQAIEAGYRNGYREGYREAQLNFHGCTDNVEND
jgi:flagellar biosynthesis/type III secretory pathway protein FliH